MSRETEAKTCLLCTHSNTQIHAHLPSVLPDRSRPPCRLPLTSFPVSHKPQKYMQLSIQFENGWVARGATEKIAYSFEYFVWSIREYPRRDRWTAEAWGPRCLTISCMSDLHVQTEAQGTDTGVALQARKERADGFPPAVLSSRWLVSHRWLSPSTWHLLWEGVTVSCKSSKAGTTADHALFWPSKVWRIDLKANRV